jgi:hypothetical protein
MFAKQTRNKLAEFKKQFFKKRGREAPTGKWRRQSLCEHIERR